MHDGVVVACHLPVQLHMEMKKFTMRYVMHVNMYTLNMERH